MLLSLYSIRSAFCPPREDKNSQIDLNETQAMVSILMTITSIQYIIHFVCKCVCVYKTFDAELPKSSRLRALMIYFGICVLFMFRKHDRSFFFSIPYTQSRSMRYFVPFFRPCVYSMRLLFFNYLNITTITHSISSEHEKSRYTFKQTNSWILRAIQFELKSEKWMHKIYENIFFFEWEWN